MIDRQLSSRIAPQSVPSIEAAVVWLVNLIVWICTQAVYLIRASAVRLMLFKTTQNSSSKTLKKRFHAATKKAGIGLRNPPVLCTQFLFSLRQAMPLVLVRQSTSSRVLAGEKS